jgi:hypothetical protein
VLPIQEIEIKTQKSRVFHVHLERWSATNFECKLAAINLGPQLPANATFGPFSTGQTATDSFKNLVNGLNQSLANLDASDSIAEINNPNNTELLKKQQQQLIIGNNVSIKVNGV